MLARRGSNWNAPIWLVRVQNATTTLENHLADSTKGPATPLLGFYPGEMRAYVHTMPCTRMLIAAFFITAPNWKHVSIKEQTRKGWGMHTAERHSEIKRNRPVTHATIWMNFKHWAEKKKPEEVQSIRCRLLEAHKQTKPTGDRNRTSGRERAGSYEGEDGNRWGMATFCLA